MTLWRSCLLYYIFKLLKRKEDRKGKDGSWTKLPGINDSISIHFDWLLRSFFCKTKTRNKGCERPSKWREKDQSDERKSIKLRVTIASKRVDTVLFIYWAHFKINSIASLWCFWEQEVSNEIELIKVVAIKTVIV